MKKAISILLVGMVCAVVFASGNAEAGKKHRLTAVDWHNYEMNLYSGCMEGMAFRLPRKTAVGMCSCVSERIAGFVRLNVSYEEDIQPFVEGHPGNIDRISGMCMDIVGIE